MKTEAEADALVKKLEAFVNGTPELREAVYCFCVGVPIPVPPAEGTDDQGKTTQYRTMSFITLPDATAVLLVNALATYAPGLLPTLYSQMSRLLMTNVSTQLDLIHRIEAIQAAEREKAAAVEEKSEPN